MSYKILAMWLCGLWALGLGARISLELLLSDTGIFVPNYTINIVFDFVPLMLFGLVTVWYQTKELFKVAQAKGWVDTE